MIKCTFENGQAAQLRHVTVVAIVVRDNAILLVKRALHLSEPGKFALPGGYLDRDETTEEAMRREVKEETGYLVSTSKFFHFVDNPNRRNDLSKQNVEFVYIAEVTGEPGEHDAESTEITWFPLDKLPPADQIAFDHLASIEQYKNSK